MSNNSDERSSGDFAHLPDDPDDAVTPDELAGIREALHGTSPSLDASVWERLLSVATDPATPDPGVELVTGPPVADLPQPGDADIPTFDDGGADDQGWDPLSPSYDASGMSLEWEDHAHLADADDVDDLGQE